MIRKYIEIIENFGYQKQNQRTFGRKNTEFGAFEKGLLPLNDRHQAEVHACKQYKSAELYAMDNNRYLPIRGGDPLEIQERADDETERLKARWNYWKQMGYF